MENLKKSKAIETLCNQLKNNKNVELAAYRNEIYLKVMSEHVLESRAKQIAKSFAAFLDTKKVYVKEFDILAGYSRNYNTTASVPYTLRNGFDIPREVECYKGYNSGKITREENDILEFFHRGIICGLYKRWASGHVIGGYKNVVMEGYGSIENNILKQIDKETGEKKDYLEALLITVQAAQKYILRYANAAERSKEYTNDATEIKNIKRIESACRSISTKPAGTFFEAVQAVWLLHEMLTIENFSGSLSLGRLDQLLFPFYEKENREESLDMEQAGEILEALWLKFADIGGGFQNVTLGGCDAQGKNSENIISLLCLKTSRKLMMDQPLVSLRCHKNMSQCLWSEALELIKTGSGFPALLNDDTVIKSKINAGVDEQDAWDYGIVGCVEPSMGGCEYSNTEELRINWSKVIELMLNKGICTITGIILGLKDTKESDSIQSFEEFYDWFNHEFVHVISMGMKACNLLDSTYSKFFPSPMLSLTMDGCIMNAQDVSASGTKYNLSSVNGCGMANTADSMSAIQQMVFKEKKLTLQRFAEIVKDNYSGNEDILMHALTRCEKYGNDLAFPDGLMKDIVDLFCSTVNSQKNSRGGRFQAGLYTVGDHTIMGKKTGALPEGRKSGTSLSNAISPVQGADRTGPTAVMNSVTKFSHTQLGNGMVLDLKFNPEFLKGNILLLRNLVDAYFIKGGMEVQFNVVSRKTLLAAQTEPDKFTHLLVRVSGFSAYFVSLDKVLQDEIIKRTEYSKV